MPAGRAKKKKRSSKADFVFEDYIPFLVNRLAISLLTYSSTEIERRGLTIPKYRILMVLRQVESSNFKRLAQMTRIEPATLSRLLDFLEESGYVRRNRSTEDTRSVLLSLSARGRVAAETMIPFSKSVEDMALEGVSKGDAGTLRRLLQHMYQNVLKQGRRPGRRK